MDLSTKGAPVLDHDADGIGHEPTRKQAGAATLAKGIAILNLVANSAAPLTFGDLQRLSGLPKATLHRLLATLRDEGLIRYSDDDRSYRLGMRLFEMAHHVWETFDLRGNAIAAMAQMRDATGESVSLGMLDSDEVIYIDELTGSHTLRTGMRLARRDPARCTAIGKAMLSAMPPGDRDMLLEADGASGRHGPGEPGELLTQLYLASARGYAMEQDEHVDGVSGIAAPIIDHRGQPVAAIGLTGPSSRLTTQTLHALGPTVIEASRQVSLNAGGSPRRVSTVPKPTEPVAADVRTAISAQALLGEMPVWSPASRRLHWIDLVAPALHSSDPVSGTSRTLPVDEIIGGMSLARNGRLILAGQSGLTIYDPHANAAVAHVPSPEAALRSNRFNGGRCDPRGRFWAATTDFLDVHGRGSLYRVAADGRVDRVLGGVDRLNGPAWSPDAATMYVSDILARQILAFDFDADAGAITNRRVLVTFPDDRPELPDGLAVDRDGYIWCAVWDGWRLHRYAPDGSLAARVVLPVPRPTNCAFGGPDLRTLFVTTARIRVADRVLAQAPHAGSVLALDCTVPGLPEPEFAWSGGGAWD